MAKFILGLAVAASFTLFTGSTVEAKGGNGGGHSNGSHSNSSHSMSHSQNSSHQNHQHNSQHQTKSSHSSQQHSYHGRQSNWSGRSWNAQYNCYCYYSPTASCYYYWCAPYQCYYPVSYCPTGSYCYDGGQ